MEYDSNLWQFCVDGPSFLIVFSWTKVGGGGGRVMGFIAKLMRKIGLKSGP